MSRDIQPNDSYGDRLHKLLPAELTAVYLAVRGQAGGDPDLFKYIFVFTAVIATVFYFGMPRIIGVVGPLSRLLYCGTFVVWIVSLDSAMFYEAFQFPAGQEKYVVYVASATAIVWSFAMPLLAKPETPT